MAKEVTVTFLGGLGDIGRNCAVLETDGKALILDCGQLFAAEDEPGVDSILPDIDYLFQLRSSIVGCVVTHGHEDHIGALATVATMGLRFPIYGSPFTLGMLSNRLLERGLLEDADLRTINDNETHQIGPFEIEFLPVTHSVPGGLISVIGTAQGLIVHSSDFKLDLTPVDGRLTDLDRLRELSSDPGVRLLLADSTNSESPGSTVSESSMTSSLEQVFDQNRDRRIITACFASHVHRVQQIIDVALAQGRQIAALGMSMNKNVTLARSLGILNVDDESFFDIENASELDPAKQCVISTGSQGEKRSSLAMAAHGSGRWITIADTDTVVLSSHPIPGNEARVSKMTNQLIRKGARVVHSGNMAIHTSGHGNRDELSALHRAVSPEWFVPVHGEFRHLVTHRELALSLGMDDHRALLATDGDQVVMKDAGLSVRTGVSSGEYVMVNGPFVGPDQGVLRDRLILGDQGVVFVATIVDVEAGVQVGIPLIETRGWLDEQVCEPIVRDMIELVREAIDEELEDPDWNISSLERRARRAAGSCVNQRTQRRPIIVPVVADI